MAEAPEETTYEETSYEETSYGDYQAAADSDPDPQPGPEPEQRFAKPLIHLARPASHYARPGETIYEFTDGPSGGLISLARDAAGLLVVDVYRTDEDVIVRGTARPNNWLGRARAFLERHDQQEQHWTDLADEAGPEGDLSSNDYADREAEREHRLDNAVELLREVTR